MEQKGNKYNNSKIYTIRSHQTDKIYIGSTCQSLSRRLSGHVVKYNTMKEKYQCSVREILQYDDYYIELLEYVNCNNIEELNKREGELIRENKDICVNIRISGRSNKEYYKENKDKILERQANYQKTDRYKKVQQKYRDKNKNVTYLCECGKDVKVMKKSHHNKTKFHLNNINKDNNINPDNID